MRLDSVAQLYSIFRQFPVVCTDSRNCAPDSLFFALKGDSFDANAFALGALEKGCKYAVIDEPEYEIDERFILADNVLEALQKLATFHRRQLATPVVAITGTNGKTTTKELMAAVLNEKYNILYTQGNLNNHIGVPLTLLKLTREHELAIVEMGANHPDEISMLCEIARPDYGLITNVGKAHLEGFGSFEGVKKTKRELYEYIARNGKQVFINPKNEHLCEMAEEAGLRDKLINYVDGAVADSSPFLEMKCSTAEGEFQVKTNLIGAYNAENVLAAVTVGAYFSVPNGQIKKGLEGYVPQNNRSQFVDTGNNKLIVDAYNANPSSMAMAINNFAQLTAVNKMLVLGDMLELGADSGQEHENVIELLQRNKFTDVILIGTEFAKANTLQYPVFNNVAELNVYLAEHPVKNFYILIKGSRGIKLEQVIDKF
ncbi:UDP-N-acetylmuramoyl-tripeptide--D-alanyl-D-alanine ligase [Paludibacter sp. 221]|uniref:UDP-N-acetylmuramoyl-tripeptide--D-alanyl-D- alanine ligase n=1 Tax=Paludibacter sp. 221 TaxID=2302939 RepID=UPI0013D59A41|nr:UDP-N-acetylmuramoyl-tripeptide--D-alanyl-D-alanine ligase [Paludibacter sp. 221]NDV47701.1 UDP-N-acetylmuramoyl-tripeptide--D-alanyl-D-alanine ligase [Paludibacter sp. 221]